MTRTFFANPLECVAVWWRLWRTDGVTLGFVTHDRDLFFDGILHRAAPGMVPSALRLSAGTGADPVDIDGLLSHDSLTAEDLLAGRYTNARVEIGAVDWETRDRMVLFSGRMGQVRADGSRFRAELQTGKAVLERDYIARTSPTCRARFCGPGCNLSATRFTHRVNLLAVDHAACTVQFDHPEPELLAGGEVRWLDGPATGLRMPLAGRSGSVLQVRGSLPDGLAVGTGALVREGCDGTIATCRARFANAANFRGEPCLPGNDMLTRYPVSA